MPRVKRGVQAKKTHKNLLKKAKGYKHGRKNLVKRAQEAVLRSGRHSFKDRRAKKRSFRQLWIIRINAGVRPLGLTYSTFMKKLADKKIELDRKVLADLAMNNPEEFKKVVEKIKS